MEFRIFVLVSKNRLGCSGSPVRSDFDTIKKSSIDVVDFTKMQE